MATNKVVARKNGIPVERFWREKVTAKIRRETWCSTYPVYFHGLGMNTASLTDDRAPRTLEEAERIAKAMVESSDDEWTMAVVYELRAIVRYGTTLDTRAYELERRAASAASDYRHVLTTATEGTNSNKPETNT